MASVQLPVNQCIVIDLDFGIFPIFIFSQKIEEQTGFFFIFRMKILHFRPDLCLLLVSNCHERII